MIQFFSGAGVFLGRSSAEISAEITAVQNQIKFWETKRADGIAMRQGATWTMFLPGASSKAEEGRQQEVAANSQLVYWRAKLAELLAEVPDAETFTIPDPGQPYVPPPENLQVTITRKTTQKQKTTNAAAFLVPAAISAVAAFFIK